MNKKTEMVYKIIKYREDLTVGELTELYNGAPWVEKKLPRNELAKVVDKLRTQGMVKPVAMRKCSVTSKTVTVWSADLQKKVDKAVVKKQAQKRARFKKFFREAAKHYGYEI